jgi:hypothetical protein
VSRNYFNYLCFAKPLTIAFHPKPIIAHANIGVLASRLGYASAFIGKVGKNAFGSFLAVIIASLSLIATNL